MKKGLLLHLYTLLFIVFGLIIQTQPVFAEKTVLQTLSGDQKTCPYIKEGLYKPYSNISTDFVLFKDVLNVTTKGSNTSKTECLQIAGSTDRFVFMVFRLFIGFSSVLAVIYIAIAGIGLILEEADPKKRISYRSMLKNALIGLLLSVSAWVILYTINNRLTTLQISDILGATGFQSVIGQGVKDAKNANIQVKQPTNTTGVGGTGSLLTVAGEVDPRTESVQFTKPGSLMKVSGVGEYVENGYTPTTIDGKIFYLGKTTTFGGVTDINTNSYKPLAIDDSIREIDLNQNDEFISARWAYNLVGKADLKSYDVEVANPTTGQSIILRPNNGIAVKDWGPHPNANSNADYDTSKAVLKKIGVPDGGNIAVRLIPKQ